MDFAANPATILLVDDDESVRRLVRQVLVKDGFRVLEAADGAQALQVAAGYDHSLDLLLTDVMMPNVNGLVLAERLSLERPGIRVLYMSGHVEMTMLIAKHHSRPNASMVVFLHVRCPPLGSWSSQLTDCSQEPKYGGTQGITEPPRAESIHLSCVACSKWGSRIN
jgi:CheY-like chemotaxis protein